MIHRPLKGAEIRLLQIPPRLSHQPSSGQGVDDIGNDCKFIHVSLDDNPEFEGLSYAWGDVTDTRQISLDGDPYTVTTSLYHTLRHLQLDGAFRTIWVDAVCINQADLVERGEQIALMRRIYQLATSVIVYLGEAWDGHELAMDFFKAAATLPGHHYEPSLEPHLSVRGHDASSKSLKENLVRFLDLPWWKRLWTGQEYALARQLSFQCGSTILPGKIVQDAYSNLRFHEGMCCWDSPSVAGDASFGIPLLHAFFRMDATELARDCSGGHSEAPIGERPVRFSDSLPGNEPQGTSRWWGPSTFLEGLDNFRCRECTDPCDKIYGLTGLYYSDEVAEQFKKPDYRLPVEELYTTVAHTIIRETSRLDILSRARGYCEPTLSLPSFVPDWSVGHPVEIDRQARLSELYDASAGRLAEWTVVDATKARTTALLVDVVCQSGAQLEAGCDLDATLSR